MITAVDTSVLIDVLGRDADHYTSSSVALERCLMEGGLVACEVVWAETAAYFKSREAMSDAFNTLGVDFSAITMFAASEAGSAWRAYRRAGGERARLIGDFLVAAHASLQADRLLTRDRGFYRKYFKRLRLVEPAAR